MSSRAGRLTHAIASRLHRPLYNLLFRDSLFIVPLRERLCRQELFYNAFKALESNGITGDYAEFGCYGGMTFALAYHEAKRHGHKAKLWAFDSFQGLPAPKLPQDDHPMWIEGSMEMSLERFHRLCREGGIPRGAYEVVPGYFEDSLPRMAVGDAPTNICLAFIDCDLYSSTMSVLTYLEPRLKHGMLLAFDDYFTWSDTQTSGQRRACLESFPAEGDWQLVPYMRFGWHGKSFVVEHA